MLCNYYNVILWGVILCRKKEKCYTGNIIISCYLLTICTTSSSCNTCSFPTLCGLCLTDEPHTSALHMGGNGDVTYKTNVWIVDKRMDSGQTWPNNGIKDTNKANHMDGFHFNEYLLQKNTVLSLK